MMVSQVPTSFAPFISSKTDSVKNKNEKKDDVSAVKVVDVQDSFIKEVENEPIEKNEPSKEELKPSLFDNIMEKVVNPRDIKDTVTVPRSIFKGYLGFMVGSGLLGTANGLIKGNNKFTKAVKFVTTLASTALMMLGTFEFVKPFMVKEDFQAEDPQFKHGSPKSSV